MVPLLTNISHGKYLLVPLMANTSLGTIYSISIQWIYWHRKQWTMYVQCVIGQDIGLGRASGGGGTNLFSGSSPLLLLLLNNLPYLTS